MGSRLLTYLLGFVASVMVARALQPAGRGAYFVIVTVASVALHCGHLSVQQANNSLWLAGSDRRTLASVSLFLGGAVGLAAAVVAGIGVLGPLSAAVPVADDALLIVALAAVPAAVTGIYLKGLLVIDDRIGTVNWSALLGTGAQTILLVGLGLVGRLTVGSVIWVWTLTMAAPLAVLVPALVRNPGLAPASWSLALHTAATGLRYHAGTVAAYLMLRVDVLMLNVAARRAEVGVYSLAVTLAEITLLVTDSMAQAAVPGQAGSDRAQAAQFTARVVRANVLIALVIVAVLAVAAPALVPLVFGAAFAPAARPLIALAPGIVAMAAQWPLRFFANRLDNPRLVSTTAVAALVTNVGLNLALIPRWGILGAAIASSVSYCATTALYVRWFLKAADRPGRDLVPRPRELIAAVAAVLGDLVRR